MKKETKFMSGEPQEYKFGKYTCIVEPSYRVGGEHIDAILLKLMEADIDKQMRDRALAK